MRIQVTLALIALLAPAPRASAPSTTGPDPSRLEPSQLEPARQDRFASVPMQRLAGDEPLVPTTTWGLPGWSGSRWQVVLEPGSQAEAVVAYDDAWSPAEVAEPVLHVRARGAGPVRGRVLSADRAGTVRVLPFELEPAAAASVEGDGDDERTAFLRAQEQHYLRLLASDASGAAWFRHRLGEVRRELGDAAGSEDADEPEGARPARPDADGEVDELYDLFSGGRALAENLQLDRALAIGAEGEEQAAIPLDEVPGVTVAPFDWSALIEGLTPEPDRFAAWIPADQHAACFPSLGGLAALLDELEREGGPLLAVAEGRAEHAGTAARYQRQLCLSLDGWARRLGPALVGEVAITGSDPYFRTGTDLAVWLEARDGAALRAVLEARQAEALRSVPGAERRSGTLGEHAWWGVTDPERRVSSYAVALEGALLVSNSLAQLGRVLEVVDGRRPALAGVPEYTFFRARYPRGGAGESALVVVPDEALRRWTGPRWRIAAARRTRAAGWLAELQARHLDQVVALLDQPAGPAAALDRAGDPDAPAGLGALWLGPAGPRSERYGTLEFLTPVIELELERATEAEVAAYGRFRERYQRSWSDWFDPIAARLELSAERAAIDLTVVPLIVRSDYRDLIEVAGEARLGARALDPHRGTLVHFALALDPEGEALQELGGELAGGLAGSLGADPLSWLGAGLSVYADRDPVWDELAAAYERGEPDLVDERLWQLPLALHLEVRDPLKLAGFLTALRGMADGVAPGLTSWETRQHGEQAYVRIGAAGPGLPPELAEAALYYAALPDALILTPREDLLRRALDRRAGTSTSGSLDEDDPFGRLDGDWLGESVALRVERQLVEILRLASGDWELERERRLAWSHLAVLEEWRRRFPDRDPRALHEALWKLRLRAPGGGELALDEELGVLGWNTWGHPWAPGDGPAGGAWPLADVARGRFGLTFEHDGLRARAELER